ncbi:MAG TPA: biotin--[acetyl-CoA-carboxylase] ligase [Marinilabiliales bacterium]|nr:MAG: biotin--[acetyl-CoA-carboxylase] ligase [Bacteroidetes bacterium GWC2_40_13]OFX72328.1 MAG: biotin--[acetyl-CoA-carboxylase] ligase [Bacteroidetes bacterium GWD2_40_43]OFX90424.1 MAG: biotin--[acetyl-CoA-carboxylase] ligase [Bacteroidetes bacterium GWE2_40_63]OFY17330.1 MAG: biotin--[acetyl-CoA-carboxylase] ligase [Bacteroidetes bacterium GWF2_40_13]OFZ27325.1 MAG: biotin--[acetyl-CoA-carboxylase] ligase [Bacteroidetes bacterium RIFOXYC2_FULL_40_12]HAN00901.1 biotin--[acetyl-CoA-carbox
MKPFTILHLTEVDSTNKYLRNQIDKSALPEGYVISADFQNSGKGLGTNTWESEANKNLTFSLLLCPGFLKAEDMFLMSKAISLGIIDALNTYQNCFTIKWPNDIYYQNKKVGGILIENQIQGSQIKFSIIGIGINVNQERFTSDAPNPISLQQILKHPLDTNECLNRILNQISIWYDMLSDGYTEKINQQYFNHLFRSHHYHDFKANNELFHAKIMEVKDDGCLVLATPTGDTRSFYMKEVEFVM